MVKVNKFVYWVPRILGIAFILFISLFSLDVFSTASNTKEILIGLLIHNIPTLILVVLFILSWKHELVGAIVFFLAGLFYIISLMITSLRNSFEWYYLSWSFIIAGPAFVIAVFFYINWLRRR